MNVEHDPFNTHANFESQLRYYLHEKQLKNQEKAEQALHTEAVLSDIHEIQEATAFNAGLTKEQLDEVFEQYGMVAVAILEYLWRGTADTPEQAYALMMQEAGDEAGQQLVDPYRKAMESKYPYHSKVGHELLRMDRQRKRRRHAWGKKDVQGLFSYMTWKRTWQKELDAQFEEMLQK